MNDRTINKTSPYRRYGVVGEFSGKLLVRYHIVNKILADKMGIHCMRNNIPCRISTTERNNVEIEVICTLRQIGELKRYTLEEKITKIQEQLSNLDKIYR